MRQHVLLIPGFFGFASIGDFAYFAHVKAALDEERRRRGLEGQTLVVDTLPTASLRKRAACVQDALVDLLERDDGAVHLLGHSSGGIDARLALSPGASLPGRAGERHLERVASVVSLSSPHLGSPLAAFLVGLQGQALLRLISLATVVALRTGRIPIAALFRLVRALGPAQLPVDAGTLLNHVYQELLTDFTRERRAELEDFMAEVGTDQALLQQITPAGMDVFNATVRDRPGVRYGSVVTCARPRGLRSAWGVGLAPYRQATHALYGSFHEITARVGALRAELGREQADALARAYGRPPAPGDNDGMVPAISQVWGHVVHATWGDHLDVLGHFHLPHHAPPHFDWLNSGSGYSLDEFVRTWGAVGRFLFDR